MHVAKLGGRPISCTFKCQFPLCFYIHGEGIPTKCNLKFAESWNLKTGPKRELRAASFWNYVSLILMTRHWHSLTHNPLRPVRELHFWTYYLWRRRYKSVSKARNQLWATALRELTRVSSSMFWLHGVPLEVAKCAGVSLLLVNRLELVWTRKSCWWIERDCISYSSIFYVHTMQHYFVEDNNCTFTTRTKVESSLSETYGAREGPNISDVTQGKKSAQPSVWHGGFSMVAERLQLQTSKLVNRWSQLCHTLGLLFRRCRVKWRICSSIVSGCSRLGLA